MIARARQCVDELGESAGEAWALWRELMTARMDAHAAALAAVYGGAPADHQVTAAATAPPATPEEVHALGEYVRADARVVGATRLASALGIPLSDAYDRPDDLVLPLGISPGVSRERAQQAARFRARRSGRV